MPSKDDNKVRWICLAVKEEMEYYRPAQNIFTKAENSLKKYCDSIHEVSFGQVSLKIERHGNKVVSSQLEIRFALKIEQAADKYRIQWNFLSGSCRIVKCGEWDQVIRDPGQLADIKSRVSYLLTCMTHSRLGCKNQMKKLLGPHLILTNQGKLKGKPPGNYRKAKRPGSVNTEEYLDKLQGTVVSPAGHLDRWL